MKATLTKLPKVELASIGLTCFEVDFKGTGFTWSGDLAYLGVDPGRNFGLTYISVDGSFVYNGVMPKGEHQDYGVKAKQLITDFCEYHCVTQGDVSIVEGASYGSPYGQVGLAEIRFGFFLGLQELGLEPKIVAPSSIRKVVFGNGKQQAMDIFPILNHNAADSLAICLYGLMLK